MLTYIILIAFFFNVVTTADVNVIEGIIQNYHTLTCYIFIISLDGFKDGFKDGARVLCSSCFARRALLVVLCSSHFNNGCLKRNQRMKPALHRRVSRAAAFAVVRSCGSRLPRATLYRALDVFFL